MIALVLYLAADLLVWVLPARVADALSVAVARVTFALTFTDFLRLGHLKREALAGAVEVHGAEHLAAARASGRGVILLSAHLGNWELGAAWLAAGGARVNVVARPHSGWVERFFMAR